METENVLVVVIENNAVQESRLFNGEHAEVIKLAEKTFLDYANGMVPDFESFSEEDIQGILDEGYVELPNGSICLAWPET